MMDQGMSNLRLGNFEFFKILLPGMHQDQLRLPSKFARVLGDRRELKMRLANGGFDMPLWDVELISRGEDMYLGRGWGQFARTCNLRDGYMLVFRYESAAVLTVTVFDLSTCRKEYPHAAAAGAGSAGAGRNARQSDEPPPHFAVTLRKSNLGTKSNQYLNVPVDFQVAHGYAQLRHVVLRMGGRSWTVNLKHSKRKQGCRTAFKYGWHQFCVDNNLEVGDTCFFLLVSERKDCKEVKDEESEDDDDADEEWEEEEDDEEEEHVLKVEVRKKDGTFID